MGGKGSKEAVYQYRGGDPGGKGGTKLMEGKDKRDLLEKNTDLQETKKNVRGESRSDVLQEDLYTLEQKNKYKDKPNNKANVANVSTKGQDTLTIISDKKD